MKNDRTHNHRKHAAGQSILSALLAILFAVLLLPLSAVAEDAEPEPLCGAEEHEHDDTCYERRLICGEAESEEHIHTEDCYETVLICEKEAHTHTLECYADETADVENSTIWKNSVKDAELTGDWAHDVVEIAKTQIGYWSSEWNYVVKEGARKHYNRYAHWYTDGENSYADWCAAFASFCLAYANVTDVPQSMACEAWTESLTEAGLYRSATDYTPKAGDLIFFCKEDDELRRAAHVGVVIAVTDEGIATVEGNRGRMVNVFNYECADPTIVGYCALPDNPDRDEPAAVRPSIPVLMTFDHDRRKCSERD